MNKVCKEENVTINTPYVLLGFNLSTWLKLTKKIFWKVTSEAQHSRLYSPQTRAKIFKLLWKCFKVALHCITFFSEALSIYKFPMTPHSQDSSSTPPLFPATQLVVLNSRPVRRCILNPASFGTEKKGMQTYPLSRQYYTEKASLTYFLIFCFSEEALWDAFSMFPWETLEKGLSLTVVQASLVVFYFQYTPVIPYCYTTPVISKFLQPHLYKGIK